MTPINENSFEIPLATPLKINAIPLKIPNLLFNADNKNHNTAKIATILNTFQPTDATVFALLNITDKHIKHQTSEVYYIIILNLNIILIYFLILFFDGFFLKIFLLVVLSLAILITFNAFSSVISSYGCSL